MFAELEYPSTLTCGSFNPPLTTTTLDWLKPSLTVVRGEGKFKQKLLKWLESTALVFSDDNHLSNLVNVKHALEGQVSVALSLGYGEDDTPYRELAVVTDSVYTLVDVSGVTLH